MDAVRFVAELRTDLGSEVVEVAPEINGARLADMVESFERQAGFDPPGGYGGLVPSFFRFGPLDQHFSATGTAFVVNGAVPVLGCECGEWGCWPFFANIVVSDDTVTWSRFMQSHRNERDYSEFGPFVFDREAYDTALADLVSGLS